MKSSSSLLFCIAFTTAIVCRSEQGTPGTAGAPAKTQALESMSKKERAYLKALNQQFDKWTKSAQSRGLNQKLPQLLFLRMPEAADKFRGTVVVNAIATAQGTIVIENGVEGLPAKLKAAISDALALWRLAPATIDDKPVNVRIQVPLEF